MIERLEKLIRLELRHRGVIPKDKKVNPRTELYNQSKYHSTFRYISLVKKLFRKLNVPEFDEEIKVEQVDTLGKLVNYAKQSRIRAEEESAKMYESTYSF